MAESAPPLSPIPMRRDALGKALTAAAIALSKGAEPKSCQNVRGSIGPSTPCSGWAGALAYFLEAAVGHQPLQPMLDQLFRGHARHLTQGIGQGPAKLTRDRKSTRLNSSH